MKLNEVIMGLDHRDANPPLKKGGKGRIILYFNIYIKWLP